MSSTTRTKVIAGVLGAIILAALAYIVFFSNSSSSQSGLSVEAGTPSPTTQTFLDLTSQLGPITFDTSILDDPRFTSLVDIHTSIIPEQAGRKNPFQPFLAAPSNTSNASSQSGSASATGG